MSDASFPIAMADPFTGRAYRDMRPSGQTIMEIVRSVPDMTDALVDRLVVCINGDAVARELWPYVKPKPTTRERPIAVTLHLAWGGGGGGSKATKSVIALVAAIALTLVTAGISNGLLGPLLGATAFGAGSIGASLAAAGVGIVGKLEVVALPNADLLRQHRRAR